MAEFTPKTSEQILKDAVDYLYHNTNLSDFNVGSVVRTILEVMAIEDAEQYFQMFVILESFFLRTASGSALDDRAKEYNVTRLPATVSIGEVVFLDTQLKRSFLISDLSAGDPVLYVEDASEFPSTPFMVQLGESGPLEQVSISAVSIADNSLTVNSGGATPPFDAVSFDHPAASTGIAEIDNLSSLVTLFNSVQPARVIPSGVTLRAAPTNVTFMVECVTVDVGTQNTGNFVSSPIRVKSTIVGVQSNIPAQRLNQIVGGAPYSGAAVVNLAEISGGRNAELDSELRDRIRQSIAELPKGTIAALASNLIGTSHTNTSQVISRARIVEDFTGNLISTSGYATVYAYVDDSSVEFNTVEERQPSDTLSAPIVFPATVLPLNNVEGFPAATISNPQAVIVDPLGTPTLTQYQAVVGNELTNTTSWVSAYPASTTVSLCEVIAHITEEGRKYYRTNKYPIGDDGITLFSATSMAGATTRLIQLLPGNVKTFTAAGVLVEDFMINEATGQIEFFDEKIPATDSAILAIYENYAALIKEAQMVVDGNLRDLQNYPGVRSAGVKVLVRPAKRSAVDVTLDISINTDLTNMSSASFLVQQVIISYVNNLDIGEDVIIAEIIERAMGILGITNCKVVTPSDDYTINHDSVAYASDIIIL